MVGVAMSATTLSLYHSVVMKADYKSLNIVLERGEVHKTRCAQSGPTVSTYYIAFYAFPDPIHREWYVH